MATVQQGLSPETTPVIILAEGCFGETSSKLALGVIRYGRWPVVAVIDSTRSGQSIHDVTGMVSAAPIVSTLADATAIPSVQQRPKALLLGNAPPGGKLPADWLSTIREAIEAGLHIINGLHFFLNQEPELVNLAQKHQSLLWDVRDPDQYRDPNGQPKFMSITTRNGRAANVHVVLTVGTDCAVGKMHAALELHQTALSSGASSGFVATGQTGILISGSGVPLDRVIGDFMAGSVETCIAEEADRLENLNPGAEHWIFVEGQGSLLHPAYSGVTLSLLHGTNPDAMVLCHKANTTAIRNFEGVKLPPLAEVTSIYQQAAAWGKPAGQQQALVAGICVNTSMLTPEEAATYLGERNQETGLPCVDPVRDSSKAVWQALQTARQQRTEVPT